MALGPEPTSMMEVMYDRAQVLTGRKFVVVVFAMVVAS